MTFSSFDTPDDLAGKAACIQEAGYRHVILYPRTDRTPYSTVAELRAAGLKVHFIYERGNPTSVDYFTAEQAQYDAAAMLQYAAAVNQPAGATHGFAVDFDPSEADINGPIAAYFTIVHAQMSGAGFLTEAYGSGLVARLLGPNGLGVIHYGYLSMSGGFGETEQARANPDAYSIAIVQEPTDNSFTVCDASSDKDTVLVESVFA